MMAQNDLWCMDCLNQFTFVWYAMTSWRRGSQEILFKCLPVTRLGFIARLPHLIAIIQCVTMKEQWRQPSQNTFDQVSTCATTAVSRWHITNILSLKILCHTLSRLRRLAEAISPSAPIYCSEQITWSLDRSNVDTSQLLRHISQSGLQWPCDVHDCTCNRVPSKIWDGIKVTSMQCCWFIAAVAVYVCAVQVCITPLAHVPCSKVSAQKMVQYQLWPHHPSDIRPEGKHGTIWKMFVQNSPHCKYCPQINNDSAPDIQCTHTHSQWNTIHSYVVYSWTSAGWWQCNSNTLVR